MATHIGREGDDYDYDDMTECGTLIGDASRLTSDWKMVTCRRCIQKRDAINARFQQYEADIVRQMGDMVAFMMREHDVSDRMAEVNQSTGE